MLKGKTYIDPMTATTLTQLVIMAAVNRHPSKKHESFSSILWFPFNELDSPLKSILLKSNISDNVSAYTMFASGIICPKGDRWQIWVSDCKERTVYAVLADPTTEGRRA